jgi:3-deoxy-D-arabino-heptulosonate 7-phosphate (DAHP) synthase class II
MVFTEFAERLKAGRTTLILRADAQALANSLPELVTF